MVYILFLCFLSGCQFLASPEAIVIEEEVVEEVLKVIEHELEAK